MKIYKFILIALVSILAFACSDEDREEFKQDLVDDIYINLLESDELLEKLIIADSEVQKGIPPVGQNRTTIESTTTKIDDTTAKFNLISNDPIQGVYAQLTTSEGTKVDRFIEIPVSSLELRDLGNGETEYSFDVDLNDTNNTDEIPTGEFCMTLSSFNKASSSTSNETLNCFEIEVINGERVLKSVETK